jgi:hypothetical protein
MSGEVLVWFGSQLPYLAVKTLLALDTIVKSFDYYMGSWQ